MFALVNLARHVDVDPGRGVARRPTQKFERRFASIEARLSRARQDAG